MDWLGQMYVLSRELPVDLSGEKSLSILSGLYNAVHVLCEGWIIKTDHGASANLSLYPRFV